MDKSRNIIIILIVIILVLIIALTGTIIFMFMQQNDDSNNERVVDNNSNNQVEEEIENIKDDVASQAEQMAISSFNAMFESYGETELSSSQVKALLNLIETNNNTETQRKVVLSSNGITTAEQVENEKRYTAQFSYDEVGYINEVIITEATATPSTDNNNEQNTTGDMEKLIFNTNFTPYLGDITGTQLNSLLQVIQESNNKNPEHQVTLSSNNLSDLNGIVATDTYTITCSQDANGYVSNINIDKKI